MENSSENDKIFECLRNDSKGISLEFVQQKISEFSSLFNSVCRIPLLEADGPDKQNLVYQLIALKKNINYALDEIGKGCSRNDYNFTCGLCAAPISVKAGEDFWTSLQKHQHFEQMVSDLMQNRLQVTYKNSTSSSKQMEQPIEASTSSGGESNNDSGIDQPENDALTPPNNMIQNSVLNEMPSTSRQRKSSKNPDNVNSFRFNFPVVYFESVSEKIYPSSLMNGVYKFDKIKEYFPIQISSRSSATCLICQCQLHSPRIHLKILTEHVLGQRHMSAAGDRKLLEKLKNYHEFWLKEEECVQAHQVYFKLDTPTTLYCALCKQCMNFSKIRSHIFHDNHKLQVLDMHYRKFLEYHLINVQVQAYGIEPEVETNNTQNNGCTTVNAVKKTPAPVRHDRKISSGRSESEQSRDGQDNQEDNGVHTIVQSVLNPNSQNIFDLIPTRLQDDLRHFKRIQQGNCHLLQCKLCKMNIPYNVPQLQEHLVLRANHAYERKIKFKYYCEICNKEEKNEASWLFHDWKGPRHENMAASRKAKVTEYECITCKTVIFGDQLSLKRHLEYVGKPHGRIHKANTLPEEVAKIFQSTEKILAEAERLKSLADNALRNTQQTQKCCEKIQSALREIYPHCRVHPFGSRVTGIGNENSDLDVFVDIGGMFIGESFQEARDQVLIIRQAARAFTKSPQQWSHIIKVDTARTPILKLHHVSTNIDCDLSFRHGLSVENTKFLKFCMDLQPVLRELVMLVKKWAEHMNFEKFSTYSLVMIAIFYMQINKHLLSVEQIRQKEMNDSLVISGWKTLAHNLPKSELEKFITPYQNTVDVLAKSFFEYYAKFDFNTYVVCPLLGRVVMKSHFLEQNGRLLPTEMDRYLDQLEGEDPEVFRANSLMCIQDPFDLSHNLTKAVQQGTLSKFQNMCKLTAEKIQLE